MNAVPLTFENPAEVPQLDTYTAGVAAHFDRLYADSIGSWPDHPEETAYVLSTDPLVHSHDLLTNYVLILSQNGRILNDNQNVLVVGGGDGADTIRYGLMGCTVDVADISVQSIGRIERLADAHGISGRIRTTNVPAQSLALEDARYGMVICNRVLEYVADDVTKYSIIRKMQAATAVGGVNVIGAWAVRPEQTASCHSELDLYSDMHGFVSRISYLSKLPWISLLSYLDSSLNDFAQPECRTRPHLRIKLIVQKIGENLISNIVAPEP